MLDLKLGIASYLTAKYTTSNHCERTFRQRVKPFSRKPIQKSFLLCIGLREYNAYIGSRGCFHSQFGMQRMNIYFLREIDSAKYHLYTVNTDDAIVFCSEILPLARCRGVECKVDAAAPGFIFTTSIHSSPYTIYTNIRKLRRDTLAYLIRMG